ncbi:MAG TPA: PA14 domain-containing protein, partial [Actinomycetota bacterium]|nr:PA14 domain-containing protein [Actinomycetota bacterium]
MQISIGGELGAGTALHTLAADRELAASWRETVRAECGAGDRHGFELQVSAGTAVYAYGLDLDVPGAPVVLLRGGRKDVPAASPVTPPPPRAAVWTGWVEADESAVFTFCKQDLTSSTAPCAVNTAAAGQADKFRLWVNGVHVNGNWRDSTFTVTPPTIDKAGQRLTRGVRYPVRIEYLRTATPPSNSNFVLLWSRPGVSFTQVPAGSLYPIAPSGANGLLARYYEGFLPSPTDDPPPSAQATLRSAVNFVWTERNPPAVAKGAAHLGNLDIHHDFGVVFEGEIVPPITGHYVFSADTDGRVSVSINDVEVAATSNDKIDDGTCSHDICNPGAAVSRTCAQGSFCAGQICLKSPYCCSVSWDADCVQKVADVCRLRCDLTPSADVFLQAGSKARIKVRYQHLGDAEQTVHGGHVRLLWSADGGPRDPVPFERLFSEVDGAAPAKGLGLNAAYFSDPDFSVEYLERVDGPVAFQPTPAQPGPSSVRTASIICGSGCSNPLPGAPALVAVRAASAAGKNVTVDVQGRGAIDGANVHIKIYEVTLDSAGAIIGGVEPPLADISVPASAIGNPASMFWGGKFTSEFTVLQGAHVFAAQQMNGGGPSAWSEPVSFDAENPAAPQPPTIEIPTGGLVSGNGSFDVSGRGTPGTTVVVKDANGNVLATATVGTNGTWTAHVDLLGSGNFNLTATAQIDVNGATVDSVTSANAVARVAVPPLTLDQPTEGAKIEGSLPRLLSVQGSGAVSSLGPVHIGDGDGRYFVDRGPANLYGDGHFDGGAVPLDYGSHKIKVFQGNGDLDNNGVVRTVLVPPPPATITTPLPNAVVDSTFAVTGRGLRQGVLPGTVVFYQADVKLGSARLQNKTANVDYGEFATSVHLSGSGEQTLQVAQTASSLSGGGTAESSPPHAAVTVIVRPAAPIIEEPGNVTRHPTTDVLVTIKGEPGYLITILVDNVAYPGGPWPAGSDGRLTKVLSLAPGSHRLTAYQAVPDHPDAQSATTDDVLIAVGDIDPPTVWITDPNCRPTEDPPGSGCLTGTNTNPACSSLAVLSVTAGDGNAVGDAATVDYANLVHAFDRRSPNLCVDVPVHCEPPSPATFGLGSTVVTCAAVDCDTVGDPGCDPDHPNHGSASFVVSVSPRAGTEPTVVATGLTAEAQGPNGAPVTYQVMGQGYLADCSLPGSGDVLPCATWEPANKGLGFAPTAVGIDPFTALPFGTLYAGFQDSVGSTRFARF